MDDLLYRLARAASIAAMSIFRIVIIAFIARLAAARSGSCVAASSARGVICHEKPQRSLHQPHIKLQPKFGSRSPVNEERLRRTWVHRGYDFGPCIRAKWPP